MRSVTASSVFVTVSASTEVFTRHPRGRGVASVLRKRTGVTRKEFAGKHHGPGTVAKALADLTAAGELVNPKDKKGYRLPEWRKDKTPSLFD